MIFFNGNLKTISGVFFLLFYFVDFTFADNTNQYLPNQIKSEIEFGEDIDGASVYVPGGTANNFLEKSEAKTPSNFLFNSNNSKTFESKKLSFKEKLMVSEAAFPSKLGTSKEMIEYKYKDLYEKIENRGARSFSITYIRDDYDISSTNNIYDSTFRNGTGSQEGGSLLFSLDYYLYRGAVNFFVGGNFGFGYAQGKGFFISGAQSETLFKLWTIPIGLSLGIEVPVTGLFKIAAFGGPSAMGLYQSRNDRAQGEAGKRRRQVSYGYFAEGRLQTSLSYISKKYAFDMFKEYSVTNAFLNLNVRMQNYENFQDNIGITGMSYGIGLSWDYL